MLKTLTDLPPIINSWFTWTPILSSVILKNSFPKLPVRVPSSRIKIFASKNNLGFNKTAKA